MANNTIKIKITKPSDNKMNWFNHLVGKTVKVFAGSFAGKDKRPYYTTADGTYKSIWADCAEEVFEMSQWLGD